MSSSSGAVSISPDGNYISSSGTEPATRLWNRRTGELVRTFVGHGAGSMAAVFTPDSANILTTYGLPSPAVRLWNVESGALERSFRWEGSWPMSVALSKNGALVAAGAQDGRVRIFDFASAALTQTLINSGWPLSVAFAPNAPLLIAGCSDSSARLWNYETGQLLHTFSAEAGSVRSVAFSPNGDTVAVAWDEGLLRLFNPLTVELRLEIVGQSFVSQVTFSPDGQYLAAAEGWPFFTASIWDARSGQLVRTLTGHLWQVGAVAFSADGAGLVTAAEILRLWDVSDLAARLSMKAVASGMELRWSLGTLQNAPQVDGAWENVANAISPHTTSTMTGAGFYRVLTPANP
jgi:WD40 repeat protein